MYLSEETCMNPKISGAVLESCSRWEKNKIYFMQLCLKHFLLKYHFIRTPCKAQLRRKWLTAGGIYPLLMAWLRPGKHLCMAIYCVIYLCSDWQSRLPHRQEHSCHSGLQHWYWGDDWGDIRTFPHWRVSRHPDCLLTCGWGSCIPAVWNLHCSQAAGESQNQNASNCTSATIIPTLRILIAVFLSLSLFYTNSLPVIILLLVCIGTVQIVCLIYSRKNNHCADLHVPQWFHY